MLDVRHHVNEGYVTYTHNGQKKTGICPQQLAHQMEVAGAGEIVINHIDRDGTREGYDFTLVELMRTACSVPITILGGAPPKMVIGTLHAVRISSTSVKSYPSRVPSRSM